MKFSPKSSIRHIARLPLGFGLYVVFSCTFITPLRAEEPADSSNILRQIDVTTTAAGRPWRLLDNGSILFSPDALAGAAGRVMGEFDVLNYLKYQPGISTSGDYGSGLMVDGATASQSLFRIGGVPVFFPYRFGGVFSTFNTPHFQSVIFSRNIQDAAFPSRLGSRFDFESRRSSDEPAGTVNVGLLSSSATVSVPIGSKVCITASGRVSYIDELYGKLIRSKKYEAWYNFHDFNLTATYQADSHNLLIADGFYSGDNLRYYDSNYVLETVMHWHNSLASLRWIHSGAYKMEHRLYYSGFSNSLGLEMPQVAVTVPSMIRQWGASGSLSLDTLSGHYGLLHRLNFSSGYDIQLFNSRMQYARLTGFEIERDNTIPPTTFALEARVYAQLNYRLNRRLKLNAGLSLSYFHGAGGYNQVSADPRLTLTWQHHRQASDRFHIGRYSQYLHQVGFSETGMASDFWICSSKGVPYQQAWGATIEHIQNLPWPGFMLNASVYFRKVSGQSEYQGQILDIINSDYSAEKYIITGKGYNVGGNLSISGAVHNVSMTLNAGYGIARRKYPHLDGWYRGVSDPGVTSSAEVLWSPRKQWNFGGIFTLASGRAYTPPLAMYMISGNLITEFGAMNSRRYPLYHRLDLSATWTLPGHIGSKQIEHLLNFSVINAYGHRNVEMRKYILDIDEGQFGIKEVTSLYRFLPSLSYTLKF